jgi:isochorismate synthase
MIISQILSKNLPFAAYRMPGEKQPFIIVQDQREIAKFDFTEVENQKGFVLAPYESYKDGRAFLLKPSFFVYDEKGREQLSEFLERLPNELPVIPEQEVNIAHKRLYLGQAQNMIDQMKAGRLNKVVLSRILIKDMSANCEIDLLFEQLCRQYSRAFVYVFHLPGMGVWAGATPETLLQKQGDTFETMALAGTQKKPEENKKITWGEKEIQEQQYVSDFIDNRLNDLEISSYEKSPAETVFAGSLAHICTRVRIPFQELTGKTGALIRSLHPTPAVCGIPKEKAWQLISDIEKHERRFYTGFLGPWNLNNRSHLFVNLRCARILEKSLEVYVGGGLTADSMPEKEWQETLDKSQTILSAIENLRNFAP